MSTTQDKTSISNSVVKSIRTEITDKDQVRISFSLPHHDGELRVEKIHLFPHHRQRNILIFHSGPCRKISFPKYNLIFLNLNLRHKTTEPYLKSKAVSRNHLIKYILQSKWNCQVIFFLENEHHNVEVLRMLDFLRDNLNSQIPIHAYFLHKSINDLFYVKLLMKRCLCKTPLVKVNYGKNAPANVSDSLYGTNITGKYFEEEEEKEDEKKKEEPPDDAYYTLAMSGQFTLSENSPINQVGKDTISGNNKTISTSSDLPNVNKYETMSDELPGASISSSQQEKGRTLYSHDTLSWSNKDDLQVDAESFWDERSPHESYLEHKKRPKTPIVVPKRKQKEERYYEDLGEKVSFDLSCIPDFHITMTVDICFRVLSSILNNVHAEKADANLEEAIALFFNDLRSDVKKADNFTQFTIYKFAKKYLPVMLENARKKMFYEISGDMLDKRLREDYKAVYYFFMRMMALLLQNLRQEISREKLVKVAKKVIFALQDYDTLPRIEMEVDGEIEKFSMSELFRHFRKHSLY